jgi:hypothetical protein
MTTKHRCGTLHARAMEHFCGRDEERIRLFTAGFITGQAEKIHLGACRAAMLRPALQHRELVRQILNYTCALYGLQWEFLDSCGEFWLFEDDYRAHVDMIDQMAQRINERELTAYEWHDYHLERGRLCGIPITQIDGRYHER